MRWGEGAEQRAIRINQEEYIRYNWHSWFAWHPVEIYNWDNDPEEGKWVWLETVQRKRNSTNCLWYYRFPK